MRTFIQLALLAGVAGFVASTACAQRITTAEPATHAQTMDGAIVDALRPTPYGMRCAELRDGIRNVLARHRMIEEDPVCRKLAYQSLVN